MAFPTRTEYEKLIYHLREAHPAVTTSTLRLYSTSALTAPNIKRNRLPAYGISFTEPNLSTLIKDSVELQEQGSSSEPRS